MEPGGITEDGTGQARRSAENTSAPADPVGLTVDPVKEPTMTVPRAGFLFFGLSRSSSYLAAQNGQLPTIRVGRKLFVPTAQMLEMVGQKAS